MQLILAIDSDPRRSEQLAHLVRARLQVDLVQATSAGEALNALKDRVPDLILTSPLLSPFDDGVLDEYLRDLGAAATHVQTVRIPMLSSGPRKKSAAKRLFSIGRKTTQTSSAAPDGCDPKIFADEIAHYLTRSLEERASLAKASEEKSLLATAPTTVQEIRAERQAHVIDDQWGAPDALVEEFRETVPVAAPPIVEDTPVPGSILDLRAPVVHAPAPQPEPAPSTYVFTEPEPVTYTSEPEPEPVSFVIQEPVLIEPESEYFVAPEPVFVKPEESPIARPAEISAPVVIASTPASAPASSTGNSASFEAALAAIRAAWAKPEPKTPAAGAAASTAGPANPVASSADGDEWIVLDPNQYDYSALVNKVEKVTDHKVTPRANGR